MKPGRTARIRPGNASIRRDSAQRTPDSAPKQKLRPTGPNGHPGKRPIRKSGLPARTKPPRPARKPEPRPVGRPIRAKRAAPKASADAPQFARRASAQGTGAKPPAPPQAHKKMKGAAQQNRAAQPNPAQNASPASGLGANGPSRGAPRQGGGRPSRATRPNGSAERGKTTTPTGPCAQDSGRRRRRFAPHPQPRPRLQPLPPRQPTETGLNGAGPKPPARDAQRGLWPPNPRYRLNSPPVWPALRRCACAASTGPALRRRSASRMALG